MEGDACQGERFGRQSWYRPCVGIPTSVLSKRCYCSQGSRCTHAATIGWDISMVHNWQGTNYIQLTVPLIHSNQENFVISDENFLPSRGPIILYRAPHISSTQPCYTLFTAHIISYTFFITLVLICSSDDTCNSCTIYTFHSPPHPKWSMFYFQLCS